MSLVSVRSPSLWKALTVFTCALGCGDAKDATAQPGASRSAGAVSAAASAGAGAAIQAVVQAAAPATPRVDDHIVFDLVDNRPLAHSLSGGHLVVLTGTPGFAKYLRFAKPKVSWTLAKEKDGQRVAIADGYANFDLPVTPAQVADATALHLRVFVAEKRKVAIKIGEKDAGSVELSATGWQTLTIPLAPGAVKAGENRFQMISGKAGTLTVAFMQLGGSPPGDKPPALYDSASQSLALGKGEGAAWYLQVPEKGGLAADVTGAGCTLAARFEPSDGAAIEGTLTGTGSVVDLSAAAGKIGRLTLTSDGCDRATFKGGLVLPGAAPVVKRDGKPKNVILVIQDSLRADRVKPFWPKARPDVPNWEILAKTGTIFRNTYVQGNESRASHAAIWSGLYAVNHKMIVDGAKLDAARWETLGEVMKKAGFATHGESANGYIIAKWGFGEGWDSYQNHIHDGGGVRGDQVQELGLKVAEKLNTKGKPWFLYLGLIDTHVSWRAKEPWIKQYSPKYEGKYKTQASGVDVEAMAAGKLKITDADKEHIRAIYDSNVSYQDKLLGDMFAKLKAWGVDQDTLVVVTADHGDEQWEDGRVGHGASLRETLIRVPLAIYYPKLFPAGTVFEGADTVDILPTLLDALGQPIPADVQGESLLPIAQGVGRGYPRPSISSQYEFAHAMRLADWKVRVGGSGIPLLFHVEADPMEKTDLADKRPTERRFLTDVFSMFMVNQRNWKKTKWGVPSNLKPAFAAELENK